MSQIEFELKFTVNAQLEFDRLLNDRSKKNVAKAVIKSLRLMVSNLKHPS